MVYFTVIVGVVEGLVPSKLAGVELGCVRKHPESGDFGHFYNLKIFQSFLSADYRQNMDSYLI